MKRFKIIVLLLVVVCALVVGCTDKDETPLSVKMTIECLSLVETPAAVADAYSTVVPADGYILSERTVKAKENESAFDLLSRVAKDNKIAVVASDSEYGKFIEYIGNVGANAVTPSYWGYWMYKVNGADAEVGASSYTVKDNDEIVFYFMIGANS